ncbi:MAG TPA: 30S ribosome-binding factor RbfA [Candidatus Limnocylindrales bacterium]|nr:30S ribosome-binding factor RbfA [Candidatus Limnocylindrales bacterium]
MSENRARRVGEQIKKDISQIIRTQIKDPRVADLTSITEVEMTRDLRYATVYVSIYGSAEEKNETILALRRAAGYIRGEIGRRIRLRYTPEINFLLDNSMEYGAHIDKVIATLKSEEIDDDDRSS